MYLVTRVIKTNELPTFLKKKKKWEDPKQGKNDNAFYDLASGVPYGHLDVLSYIKPSLVCRGKGLNMGRMYTGR